MNNKVVEATAGDYRFSLYKNNDRTYRCTRSPIDDPTNIEELTDWAELPEQVRRIFTQAQNQAA